MNEALPILAFTLVYGIALIARRARERNQAGWQRDAAITLASFALAIVLVGGALFMLTTLTTWIRPNLATSIGVVLAIVLASESLDYLLRSIFPAPPPEKPDRRTRR